MEQFKRAKVIMLPTENINIKTIHINLVKQKDSNNYVLFNSVDFMKHGVSQHLYIISDEDLLSNDYGINTLTNTIIQNGKAAVTLNDWKYIKRIIATTDTSLTLSCNCKITCKTTKEFCNEYKTLPQPSKQFITKYIEEYNKDNVITDVLVEYKNNYDLHYYTPPGGIECCKKIDNWKLKINPKDNTIIISELKK